MRCDMKLEEGTLERSIRRVRNVGSDARVPGFESWFLNYVTFAKFILTSPCPVCPSAK